MAAAIRLICVARGNLASCRIQRALSQPGTISITQRVLQDAKPGSIVLMHDGGGVRSQTVEALPEIIKGLRAKGFTIVSVPQLLLDDPPPRDQPLPRRLDGG